MLSESEAEENYESTLQYISNVALFQYTFTVTVCYAFISSTPETTNFLRLSFSRFAWATVSNLGAVIINFHIARQLNYLKKLVLMHPKNRRKLRFLTRHHRWLFNPFRTTIYQKSAYRSIYHLFYTFRYLAVLHLALFPAIHMLDSDPRYQRLAEVGGYDFWFTYITVSALGIFHYASIFVVMFSIIGLGNALWKGQYLPKESERKLKRKNKQAENIDKLKGS